MSIYRGSGGSGDATNDATVTAVQTYATQAATSATNAATSATNAATSASGAATSATNAANSATTAAGQATTAAGHASSASTYATNSALSADDSADYALESQTYASQTFDSATAAALSASDAEDSATSAGTSATSASSSAASALAIYGNTTAMNAAVASATASASSASTSASTATTKASEAASSASTATTQATNAAASASAADADATSASIDADEAQAAATAAQAAVGYATAIYGSLASIQQATANTVANRDAAAASATSASNSASTAATQAGIATTQATNAAASAAAASAVVLSNEPVRPTVRPSLLLDFANAKQLDPRVTFSRPTTARYYDEKTSVVAEQNLVSNSGTFSPFTVDGTTTTANSTTAPDGTSTAYTLTENTATAFHRMQWVSPPSGSAGTLSLFAKQNTQRYLYISTFNGTSHVVIFDLQTGTVTQNDATATVSITSAGNGWYRCSVGVTGSVTYLEFGMSSTGTTANTTTVPYYLGASLSIYMWGIQYEARNSLTAYTATSGTAITNYIPVLLTQQSNEARFDHNPTTRESLGLLIEEQRTNLYTYSSDFSNAFWFKSNSSITADTTIAPDGTQTGDKLIENSATSARYIYAVTTLTATSYTYSFYAKASGRFNLSVGRVDSNINFFTHTFNLNAGTTSGGTITSVGNGWYRCSGTITVNTGASTGVIISMADGAGATSYAGNGFDGVFLWGAQLEAGTFATSYIPTVASQVTRSADSASMTGTNFSSWYNISEGTFYSEFARINVNTSTYSALFTTDSLLAFSDGTYENMKNITANDQISIASSGTSQKKASYVYSQAIGYGFLINAGSSLTSKATKISSATFIYFNPVGNPASIRIKKFAYYPVAISNAELQGVTTI